MTQNNSEAAAYADSVEVQESSSVEIDLYAELTSFELLTPEEQATFAVHPEISTAEENPPEDVTAQSPEDGSDPGHTPFGFVGTAAAEQTSVANDVEGPALSDSQHAYSEIDGNADTLEAERSLSSSDTEVPCVSFETPSELTINEEVLICETKSEPDTPLTFETPINENIEAAEIQPDVSVQPSGPLESLDGNIEFTGDLSRGVCIACGAESSSDDLFCLACGVFVDDI